MYDYIYQYRGNIERIIDNIDRDSAWQYTRNLYAEGLISLPEWNILSEYSKAYKRSYK